MFNKKITETYWAMIGEPSTQEITPHQDSCCNNTTKTATKVIDRLIPVKISAWELAGFMRGKCDPDKWLRELTFPGDAAALEHALTTLDPEQWIEAACKAWDVRE